MDNYLHLKHLCFKYTGIGASTQDVLNNITLSLGVNECVAIIGQSGSGKTTLIQHFTGLLKPSSGYVFYGDQDIWAKSFRKSVLRKKIGLVFQFPETQLFEESVAKDIAFGPKNMGLQQVDIEQRVVEAMQAMELDPALFRNRSPFHLSEGEKRRVAIAGVLAMQPDMLVFDEPTAGLDPKSVQRFAMIVRRLVEAGKAIVIVSHSMDFVAEVADRVIALHAGKLVYDGNPCDFFADIKRLRDIGLERPSLLEALDTWHRPVPPFLQGVISFQEFQNKIKKFAHFHEL
ncbi:ATP-binding cassette domain-containing protein [candidate division KSB1 bacterium]|nr:energy-coupling factor transporter ATPase [candidate division KSB1 bacterium]RQW07191.1 MAG: ATP-binding cassette domain-containing protein [candidate division KSB1 bacterium]